MIAISNMTAENHLQRRHVLFFGRVQGVGFRFTTRDIARRFCVVGHVQNLPDGSVQLVVEGAADVLEEFITAIESQMGRNILSRQVTESEATGEFSTFEVRR